MEKDNKTIINKDIINNIDQNSTSEKFKIEGDEELFIDQNLKRIMIRL
jgi:hypothetical protein